MNIDLQIDLKEFCLRLGLTRDELEYKPRLCKIEKQQSGYGFSLLYLEDRKGEYVENLTPNGSAQMAGIS